MLLLVLLSSVFSFAQASDCSPERWIKPAVISEGVFQGTLEASCTIKSSSSRIPSLYKHFRQKVLSNVETLHFGPISEHALGMPGEKFDITAKEKEGRIRNLIILASDQRESLIYDIRSKQINFSGMAGYLRKLDVIIKVTETPSGDLNVKLTNTTHVAKPAVAPSGIFLNIAIKQSKEQFQAELKRLVSEINLLR